MFRPGRWTFPIGGCAVFATIGLVHAQVASARMSELRSLEAAADQAGRERSAAKEATPSGRSDMRLAGLAETLREFALGEPAWTIEDSAVQAGVGTTQVSVRFRSDFAGIAAFLQRTWSLPGPVRTERLSIRRDRTTERGPLQVDLKLIVISEGRE